MKGRSIFGGLFLIFLGLIFLLNNLGLIGWDIWWAFVQFWPLVLIAFGIRLIFGNNIFIQIVAFLLIFIIPVAFYFGYGGKYLPRWVETPETGSYNWALENDPNITAGNLRLNIGAGTVNLQQGDTPAALNARTISGAPDVKSEIQGTRTIIQIKQQDFRMAPMFFGHRSLEESWRLTLGKNILWDLDVQTGAGVALLDMSDIKFNRLRVHTGAGNVRCVFDLLSQTAEAEIDTGAGNITLVIPEDVGVRAKVTTGVGNKSMEGRNWDKDNDTYTSNNYAQAAAKLNLTIHSGAGNITIQTQKAW